MLSVTRTKKFQKTQNMPSNSFVELPSHKINVKIDIKTWKSLDNLKKRKETFDDVIRSLLKERTISVEGKNAKAIKYNRKTLFFETFWLLEKNGPQDLGIEFEYNDVKGEVSNFTLDVKLKKIFAGKKAMNPSIFFGVDGIHKHFNNFYLKLYLRCAALVLQKEFGVNYLNYLKENSENIVNWKKLYNDYSLSEDSFINDIEEPLRLSVDEKPNKEILKNIKKSPSYVWESE